MSETDSDSSITSETGILTSYCWLKTEKKKSKLFYLTIKNVNQEEHGKSEVFNELEPSSEQLMIADTSFKSEMDYEHRIYIRLKKLASMDIFSKKIKSIYSTLLPRDICIETPGHSRIIRRCSQYDIGPISKGLNEDDFSLVFLIHKWTVNTLNFNLSDPFLKAHRINVEFAKKYHKSFHDSIKTLLPLQKITQVKRFNSWQDKVVDWYNDWLEADDYSINKKHLYLYGDTNTGKTHFILRFLFAKYRNQIFRPCVAEDKFAFSHFNPSVHNILIEDEFDLDVSTFIYILIVEHN
jgi:hypothetical protein